VDGRGAASMKAPVLSEAQAFSALKNNAYGRYRAA
jgi:hypothetical protein